MSGIAFELLDRIERWAIDSPRGIAYIEPGSGRCLQYSELCSRVMALASFVSNELGSDGGVVMLRCANRIEFPIWFLALLAAGARVFPVSVELTDAEVSGLASHVGVRAIVAQDSTSTSWSVDRALSGEVADGLALRTSLPGDLF